MLRKLPTAAGIVVLAFACAFAGDAVAANRWLLARRHRSPRSSQAHRPRRRSPQRRSSASIRGRRARIIKSRRTRSRLLTLRRLACTA